MRLKTKIKLFPKYYPVNKDIVLNLRHTFATTALQNGVDVKTVSSMLGHYDAGFILRTYTHATRQKQDEAAQTMGAFMEQVM